ncbi:MAG: PIN/TRAM domain-containing protein [Planctomycetaceae bacterium]|nr:PIN/TRAM domain-containing protein [Planctomycetaceae bacterium]
MPLILLRILYFFVCAGATATFVSPGAETDHPITFVNDHAVLSFCLVLGFTQLLPIIDLFIPRKRIETISAVYFGVLIGALLSYLLIQALVPVISSLEADEYQGGVSMVITLVLTYSTVSLLLQTKDDFRFVIPYVEFARELKGGKPLILDSSALIDGRIADVTETKILDAQLLVPDFILQEVQDVADSNDKNRRNRGRRGLDVLTKLQNNPNVEVKVYEAREIEGVGGSVDNRLVLLAKELGGRVVTNDFNLNKVASVQSVDVVNLNDVANSLRPRYLPGEHLRIKIIKEGESAGQGIGYLDDGTMVVCEQTSHMIGKDVDCIVTSVLQSSAGRMIFTRLD